MYTNYGQNLINPNFILQIILCCLLASENYVNCVIELPRKLSFVQKNSRISIDIEQGLNHSKILDQHDQNNGCNVTNAGRDNYSICAGKFCLPKNYDPLTLPTPQTNSDILDIGMDFDIIEISEVDDKEFTVSLNMYLGVYWQDLRLTGPYFCDIQDGLAPVDFDMLTRMWLPDVYIHHLKSNNVLDILRQFKGI